MIDKFEIDSKSKEFDINPSNVQRDYIFGWMLAGIYGPSDLGNHLVLRGGNGFRKAYFANTRYSSDLDFSTKKSLDHEYVKRELGLVCDFVQENSGVTFEKDNTIVEKKKRVDKNKDVIECRIYFKDFYGAKGKMILRVMLDITQFDKIYLPVQKIPLIHPYSDNNICQAELKCMKLEEMLASKLKCLLQRRHSSDFYDYLTHLMFDHALEVNKKEIANAFLKMTIFQRSPGAARGLLIDLPFGMLKNLWEKFVVCPPKGLINFDKAIQSFKKNISTLFGSENYARGVSAFFPAHLRNPIMEAAHSMTLLRINYNNRERLVEPYSLAYKTRKDGVAQEYFYVWDQTGGNRGGPGLKSFLQHNINKLENTDTTFEPRFEVELKKAGEYPSNSYFARPFGGKRKENIRRRLNASSLRPRKGIILGTGLQMTYIVECPYCGKKFRRKTNNAKLNKHKDQYGDPCYGIMGIVIDYY